MSKVLNTAHAHKAVERTAFFHKRELSMNQNIDFEILVDCTNELKAIGDIMMASNPDVELCSNTVGQLGIMVFQTVTKLQASLKINETP